MNLTKLFETQRKLDERIVKEKGLEGQDLLPMKILALQVELGELANEWRGFKFWSEDRKPRTKFLKNPVSTAVGMFPEYRNPLLEEYVDCLHFILSIGLELDIYDHWELDFIEQEQEFDVTEQFIAFNKYLKLKMNEHDWFEVVSLFLGLGELLGFTWEQIEQAYYAKNAVNHTRQTNGY